jgi:hypothetical protein
VHATAVAIVGQPPGGATRKAHWLLPRNSGHDVG